jgi:hypothetical protein
MPTTPEYYSGVVGIGSKRTLPFFGYGNRNKSGSSEQDTLEANWVFVRNYSAQSVLIVSLDTLFSSRDLECRIKGHFYTAGFPSLHLFVVASHTHFAPSLDPTKPKLGVADDVYINDVAERIFHGILKAMNAENSQSPLEWNFFSGTNRGAIYRRNKRIVLSYKKHRPFVSSSMQMAPNFSVEIDHELRIWVASDKAKNPLFAVTTWPCHATSRREDDVVSADFVHAVRYEIRKTSGFDLPVVFFPGASGDIRPNFSKLSVGTRLFYPYPFQKSFNRPSEEMVEEFDRSLRETVAFCLSEQKQSLSFTHTAAQQVDVPLSEFMHDADDVEMPLQHLLLGGLEILGFGAEISSHWPKILNLEDASKQCIVSGYVGPNFGYLPTDAQVPEGGYEVNGFRRGFDIKAYYGEDISIQRVLEHHLKKLIGSS